MEPIYLDNNATTRVAPEVRDEMLPFLDELYGNPSSPHHFGGRVERHLTDARLKVAALLGCSQREIVFTSGGTEAVNLAIRGVLSANPTRRHIVTSQVEHSAVLVQCRELQKQGYTVDYLPVDSSGSPDLSDLHAVIREDTAIVSLMWANNETGVIFPMDEIAALCHEKGVYLHADAVQAVGKIPVDLNKTSVDLLSLSGHKIHAPKGVGALFIRKAVPIRPLLWGGHQERGRRPGTEPVASIVGMGKAAQLAAEGVSAWGEQMRNLRDRLETELSKRIPNLQINGRNAPRLPNTLNVCFPGVRGEDMLVKMDQNGIAASSGSACLSHRLEPSHVLLAMGVSEKQARSAVRFSLSRYTTQEEIDRTVSTLVDIRNNRMAQSDRLVI